MKTLGHHLIFEGAELSGKSFLMSGVYDFLEKKYNKNKTVLDGCHWLNTDIGIFGTNLGKPCIEKFTEILEIIKAKNVMFEKFHISDIVYSRLHRHVEVPYAKIEQTLKSLGAKIVLCQFPENEKLIQKRLNDRLSLYPHYKRIAHNPQWYIVQQQEYQKEINKTVLPHITVDLSHLPDPKAVNKILEWMGEKM